MADITTHQPVSLPRTSGLSLPEVRIGARLFAMSTALGRAFEMAYVAPFQTIKRREPPVSDDELQGRDPNW
jgi:hypothetical protein